LEESLQFEELLQSVYVSMSVTDCSIGQSWLAHSCEWFVFASCLCIVCIWLPIGWVVHSLQNHPPFSSSQTRL